MWDSVAVAVAAAIDVAASRIVVKQRRAWAENITPDPFRQASRVSRGSGGLARRVPRCQAEGRRVSSRAMDDYDILAGPGEAELKIQRSRFLAWAGPAVDEAAARLAVADMQKRYHDCRHVCHAWRLGAPPATAEARADAGEPAGTAGEPILAAIRQAELTDTAVVVARYFGGVKLGPGGLARAYGGAAAAALAAAPRRTIRLGREFSLRFGYSQQGIVSRLLVQHDGRTLAEDFGGAVVWVVWLPLAHAEGFVRDVIEATAGTVVPGAR
jgi:uncharacterized YigZ family protein